MTLIELNNKIQAFDLDSELDKIISKNEDVLVDANTDMLFSGIDANNKSLGEYAPSTIEYKKAKGHPYDRITLKDEGDYYTGKKLVKGNGYTIISSDYKNAKLVEQFGIDINSVDKSRMATITDEILTPELTEAYQKAIG
jgi:hypothetical protein